MAAATVSSTAVGRFGQTSPTPTVMMIPITITLSTTAYATATGGIPFDLYTFLAGLSPHWANSSVSAYKDILGFVGGTTTGYRGDQFAVGTVTSSTIPCTMRLWNGTTEHADANSSAVIIGFLLVARNGAN